MSLLTDFYGGGSSGGGGIKSVQTVNGFLSNTNSADVTITAVDLSKTFITMSNRPGGTSLRDLCTAELTSTTNVRIQKSQSSGVATYRIFVVEFN